MPITTLSLSNSGNKNLDLLKAGKKYLGMMPYANLV
jgi:hypothetical protein